MFQFSLFDAVWPEVAPSAISPLSLPFSLVGHHCEVEVIERCFESGKPSCAHVKAPATANIGFAQIVSEGCAHWKIIGCKQVGTRFGRQMFKSFDAAFYAVDEWIGHRGTLN